MTSVGVYVQICAAHIFVWPTTYPDATRTRHCQPHGTPHEQHKKIPAQWSFPATSRSSWPASACPSSAWRATVRGCIYLYIHTCMYMDTCMCMCASPEIGSASPLTSHTPTTTNTNTQRHHCLLERRDGGRHGARGRHGPLRQGGPLWRLHQGGGRGGARGGGQGNSTCVFVLVSRRGCWVDGPASPIPSPLHRHSRHIRRH